MKLFINEFIKDYKKKITWLYLISIFAIMAIFNVLVSFSYKNMENSQIPPGEELVFLSLKASLWVSSIFILIIFANNVTQEYSRGTAKFLYSRPKSRSGILTAKLFLGIFNYLIFSALTFIFDLALNKFVFNKDRINLHTVFTTKMSDNYFGRLLWQQLGIYFLSFSALMIFFISLVLIICIIFKTQILSVVVVVVLFISNDLINMLVGYAVTKFSYVKYIFTNITNITAYYESESSRKLVGEMSKLNDTNLLIMALSYTVAFLLISYIIHARRDITLD